MLGTNVLFENGMEAILGATMTPVWSDNYIGGRDFSDRDLSNTAAVAAENRGLFRNWSIPGWTIGVHRHYPYTEEAEAAMAIWDPVSGARESMRDAGHALPDVHAAVDRVDRQ